jgi:hypothetical protein
LADPAALWGAILDRLEADIAMAVSGGDTGPWEAPASPGPIPEQLHARAAQILDAQRESIRMLTRHRADAAAHREALDSVPGFRTAGHAFYLDVRG